MAARWDIKYMVENSYAKVSGVKTLKAKHEKQAREDFLWMLSHQDIDGTVTIQSIKRKS